MNLAFVQKKFSFAERLVVPRPSGHVLCDVCVHQKRPAGLEIHVGVADVGLAFPQGLHFGTVQHQSGFQLFKKMIVVGSRAVLCDDRYLLARPFRLLALLRLLGRLGHNLSFYPMTRLIGMPGTAVSPGLSLPSCRSSAQRKAAPLAHGTV